MGKQNASPAVIAVAVVVLIAIVFGLYRWQFASPSPSDAVPPLTEGSMIGSPGQPIGQPQPSPGGPRPDPAKSFSLDRPSSTSNH
jgi:hypothetical protein